MPSTQAIYYRAPDGSEPVSDFVAGLDERKQPTVDLQIDRLNDQPTTAPPPPSRTRARYAASCVSYAVTTAPSSIGFSTGALAT
jgi:hypothetical protein